MKIIFYDVDHGSCCHIITPKNQHILVDIGSKKDESIVAQIKNKYFKYTSDGIDELIITHPHEDHILDLPNLNKLLRPKALCRPKGAFDIEPKDNTDTHKEIADIANTINKEYNRILKEEDNVHLRQTNGGIDIQVISPKNEWTTKDDLNTFSFLIIIKFFDYKFVITGDNPASVLKKMMDSDFENIKEKVKNATVLLAPHHGRENEFCKEFFECVNPCLTVISDKSIVHATQENTAQLYKGRGAMLWGKMHYVLTTRNNGTISFDIGNDHCIVDVEKGVQK